MTRSAEAALLVTASVVAAFGTALVGLTQGTGLDASQLEWHPRAGGLRREVLGERRFEEEPRALARGSLLFVCVV